jgi:formylglycine-generating enzyme required for sulfatase activity
MPHLLRRPLPALLLAALALALPLASGADKTKGKRYALLVGVKDYDHSKLSPLKYTENDVEALAKVLKDKGKFSSVALLTSSRGEKRAGDKPTGKNIRAALKALLAKKTRHDTLLVALSGHGLQLKVKKKDEAFFCPCDAQLSDPTTMIGLKELFERLDESGAGVKLLLVDACRNDPRLGRNVDVDNLPRPPHGTAALFSCASGERAFESPKLGKGHGVFFHFILQGLNGAAENVRGEVTWDRLAEYVKDKVSDEVPTLIGDGAKQSPHEIRNLVGKSPVLFKTAEAEVKNSIGMELKLIPAGEFMMGSDKDEQDAVVASVPESLRKAVRGWVKAEGPQHRVRITKPFYMGVYTVTQAEYEKVMGENPSYFWARGGGKGKVEGLDTRRFPVEQVSWEDATKFCEKLSARAAEKEAGRAYRLPTEAEWERACRARTSTPFHFGKSASSRQANFDGNYPYGGAEKGPYLRRACKVGSYRPNVFGLFDMHGNVWQWCADWYKKDYYRESPKDDPKGPKSGAARVVRGGSWLNYGWYCRAAGRLRLEPGSRVSGVGFRVVCVPAARTR